MAVPAIECGSPPNGVVNVEYMPHTFPVTGGVPPLVFTAEGLPPGITLDASTGVISGIPTAVGSYTFTVTVTDDNDDSDSVECTIVISNNKFRLQVYDDGSGEYLFDAPISNLICAGSEDSTFTQLTSNAIGPFIVASPKAVTKPGLVTIQISNVNDPLNDGGVDPNTIQAYVALVFAVPKKCKGQSPSGAGVRPGVLA